VTGQGLPLYRQAADKILAMIASGELGPLFTVPEATDRTGFAAWSVRKAAEHLAERGLIEPHQGSGYQVLVTPGQAAVEQADDRSVREQVAGLQREMADVRQRIGRIEAGIATLTGRPRGGKREQADTAASGGRR
jgi:DNA-binding GntR family transcriptional regulator